MATDWVLRIPIQLCGYSYVHPLYVHNKSLFVRHREYNDGYHRVLLKEIPSISLGGAQGQQILCRIKGCTNWFLRFLTSLNTIPPL